MYLANDLLAKIVCHYNYPDFNKNLFTCDLLDYSTFFYLSECQKLCLQPSNYNRHSPINESTIDLVHSYSEFLIKTYPSMPECISINTPKELDRYYEREGYNLSLAFFDKNKHNILLHPFLIEYGISKGYFRPVDLLEVCPQFKSLKDLLADPNKLASMDNIPNPVKLAEYILHQHGMHRITDIWNTYDSKFYFDNTKNTWPRDLFSKIDTLLSFKVQTNHRNFVMLYTLLKHVKVRMGFYDMKNYFILQYTNNYTYKKITNGINSRNYQKICWLLEPHFVYGTFLEQFMSPNAEPTLNLTTEQLIASGRYPYLVSLCDSVFLRDYKDADLDIYRIYHKMSTFNFFSCFIYKTGTVTHNNLSLLDNPELFQGVKERFVTDLLPGGKEIFIALITKSNISNENLSIIEFLNRFLDGPLNTPQAIWDFIIDANHMHELFNESISPSIHVLYSKFYHSNLFLHLALHDPMALVIRQNIIKKANEIVAESVHRRNYSKQVNDRLRYSPGATTLFDLFESLIQPTGVTRVSRIDDPVINLFDSSPPKFIQKIASLQMSPLAITDSG